MSDPSSTVTDLAAASQWSPLSAHSCPCRAAVSILTLRADSITPLTHFFKTSSILLVNEQHSQLGDSGNKSWKKNAYQLYMCLQCLLRIRLHAPTAEALRSKSDSLLPAQSSAADENMTSFIVGGCVVDRNEVTSLEITFKIYFFILSLCLGDYVFWHMRFTADYRFTGLVWCSRAIHFLKTTGDK